MSQIKGKNTRPEILVRKWLWHNGYRYRINDKRLPGKPDIVIPRLKTVIFVNGCFWHGHDNCRKFNIPQTNTQFWSDKIMRNRHRDSRHHTSLKDMGWKVLVVWECQLDRSKMLDTLQSLLVRLSQIYLSRLSLYTIDSSSPIAADCQITYETQQ